MKIFALLLSVMSFSTMVCSQDGSAATADTTKKSDYFEPDEETSFDIQVTIEELYNSVSGPKGYRRWDQLRRICHPDVRFMSVRRLPNGDEQLSVRNLEEFIASSNAFAQTSEFYEEQTSVLGDYYESIAHMFSTYRARFGKWEQRGTNSIQLVKHNGKWKVLSVLWDSADPIETELTAEEEKEEERKKLDKEQKKSKKK